MKYLIAEIGNNHLGYVEKAKEMIRISKECGATHAKMQAFVAKDVAEKGSMPFRFYQNCEMRFSDYVDLIEYGNDIGIPVFFSIFSKQYESLSYHQNWFKIAGGQVKLGFKEIAKKDTKRTFVSVPEFSICPPLRKSQILSVTEYMCKHPNLDHINFLKKYYGRPVGLSDHSISLEPVLKAIKYYDVPVVEKHFTLTRDIKFKGKVFRDALHSVLPDGLEQIAKELN